ncbi:MAG: cytochrome c family protein [Alphaproteobacteria bacterium]|nr:cytochrome c family protein [Alphaproteobacteria bacterium]MBF0394173.1 cytochrome c family protein [Alphaproteobacteria bacterium]
MKIQGLLAAALLVVSGAGGAGAQEQAAAAGSADEGAKVFNRCKACHTVEAGKHRVGPSLHGVMGRKAGAAQGFNYSDAMKKSDVTWSPETLSKYLEDPKAFIPGNKMIFAGLKKEDERRDVIAYLEKEGGAAAAGQKAEVPKSSK